MKVLSQGIGMLSRFNAWLAWVVKMLVVAQATVMVTTIVLQVATRVVLNWSPPWTEEVSLLMFGWIVMLMTAIGVREHLHVRVDALAKALPHRSSAILERLIHAITAGVAAYLLWAGYDYLVEMRGSTSNAIRYPMELLYLSLPLSGLLMLLFAGENVLKGTQTRHLLADLPPDLAPELVGNRSSERGS